MTKVQIKFVAALAVHTIELNFNLLWMASALVPFSGSPGPITGHNLGGSVNKKCHSRGQNLSDRHIALVTDSDVKGDRKGVTSIPQRILRIKSMEDWRRTGTLYLEILYPVLLLYQVGISGREDHG